MMDILLQSQELLPQLTGPHRQQQLAVLGRLDELKHVERDRARDLRVPRRRVAWRVAAARAQLANGMARADARGGG